MGDEPVREATLRLEIRERLRPVCEGWPHEVFEQLIERIARLTLKYEHGTQTPIHKNSLSREIDALREALEHSEARRRAHPEEQIPESD